MTGGHGSCGGARPQLLAAPDLKFQQKNFSSCYYCLSWIYKYCALSAVARPSWDTAHAKSVTEWKTVPILQINANFFNCAHTMHLVISFNSTEYISEAKKLIVFSTSIQLLLSLSLFNYIPDANLQVDTRGCRTVCLWIISLWCDGLEAQPYAVQPRDSDNCCTETAWSDTQILILYPFY